MGRRTKRSRDGYTEGQNYKKRGERDGKEERRTEWRREEQR